LYNASKSFRHLYLLEVSVREFTGNTIQFASVLAPLMLFVAASARADAQLIAPKAATPDDVVQKMLRFAQVGARDIVLDLGCGDGRIPIAAARVYHARGICIELDEDMYDKAIINAQRAGVSNLIEFRKEDVRQASFHGATVITMFLNPAANLALLPKLKTMPARTRIVSLQYTLGASWKPDRSLVFRDLKGIERRLYLWTVQ
jgi:tRNA A58 N-methylase Trm61